MARCFICTHSTLFSGEFKLKDGTFICGDCARKSKLGFRQIHLIWQEQPYTLDEVKAAIDHQNDLKRRRLNGEDPDDPEDE